MVRFSVSDNLLLPLVLPGALLLVALFLALSLLFASDMSIWIGGVNDRLVGPAGSAWVVLITAILAASFLVLYVSAIFAGAILAIADSYVEYYVLDSYRTGKLGISKGNTGNSGSSILII